MFRLLVVIQIQYHRSHQYLKTHSEQIALTKVLEFIWKVLCGEYLKLCCFCCLQLAVDFFKCDLHLRYKSSLVLSPYSNH